MSATKFTTISAAQKLMKSMEVAINNMIDEVKRPVDPEAGGSGTQGRASVNQADCH